MKRTTVVIAWLIGLASLAGFAQELSDLEYLEALDAARFFDEAINALSIRIVSETPEETREAILDLKFLDDEAGSFARIEFSSPQELAGQIFLSTPEATYFFGPDLDFPIKTSATAEVFGDAAVAQTSGIRFADSYTISERRSVENEEGKEVWEVDLAAVDFTVAFQVVTVTVDPETVRPLSAMLFAVSGIPFYEVFYAEYVEQENGDVYVRTQRIENQLLTGRVTTSEVLSLAIEAFDPALFDPEALGSSEAP